MAFEKQKLLDCDRQNFTECDRCIINLLRPHLMQEGEANLEDSQIQDVLTQCKQAVERGGAIGVTHDGQVQFVTKRAEILLKQYVASEDSRILPDLVKHWFKHQISQLTFCEVPSPCLPLHIERDGWQLSVYLVPDPSRDRYLLLLEERDLPSFSVNALELLGLTKREAQVLFWIARDKSNAGIAKELGCCEGTVRKHLEHVYKKLGAQTRTGAVMFALEKLGLLNEKFVAKSS
ncbi:MAG: LuxR C-terminal-related transcriptional regulator [Synechococcus sp.]